MTTTAATSSGQPTSANQLGTLGTGAGLGFDGVTLLTVYLVLLLAVPSQYVITALGSVGGPATLVGLAAGFWWCWYQLQRVETEPTLDPPGQPVRVAGLIFFAAGIASYAAAMLRAIPAAELTSAGSGVLRLVAWIGILLVANDGIRNGQRLEVLLRRMVLAGGIVALIGLAQVFTGQTLVDRLSVPGLSSNQVFAAVQTRSGFIRSTGTAVHPLEYAAVLTMIFPLALTRALEKTGSLVWRWWPAVVIAAAGAVSVSRSTMLCLAVGMLVMLFTWPSSIRRWMLSIGSALVVAVFLVVPGMLGAVFSLFSGISTDSSALSRTGSFELVLDFYNRAPIFGRGLATFLPEYRILDNQYFGVVIEMGLVGLVALLGIVAAAFASAERARRTMVARRPWAQALSASVASGAAGLAFVDGFSFPQSVGMFFLVAGICGGAWRVARLEKKAAAGPAEA